MERRDGGGALRLPPTASGTFRGEVVACRMAGQKFDAPAAAIHGQGRELLSVVIRRSIASLHEYLGRKIGEQKEAESLLIKAGQLRAQLNHRQLALLTHALKHPGETYRVAKH